MASKTGSWRASAYLAGTLLLATAAAPAGAAADPAPDPAAPLFAPTSVAEIEMTLPQASLDGLEAEPDEYQPGTLSLEAGAESFGPLEVGVRLKGGFGSFRTLSEKAAFKVKLDEVVSGQRLLGLKKLTLNNMVQDPSMIHETLAYEAFRAAGVPAPRTGYAYVTVNGEDYGLYLDVETLDSVSLPSWFASTQHLYEGEYGADLIPDGVDNFEVDEGKKSNQDDLYALLAAAGSEGGDWSDGMTAVADLEEMTAMWAVERYIGHWDGYSPQGNGSQPNNFYLHSDASGMFRMLPWGTDQTWGVHLGFDDNAAGVLFARCLADTSCAAMYRDAVRGVAASIAALDLESRSSELATELAPWELADPRREYTTDQIEEAVEGTRAFIAARPAEAAEWVGDPPAEEPLPQPAGASPQLPPAVSAPPPPETAAPKLRRHRHRKARRHRRCPRGKNRAATRCVAPAVKSVAVSLDGVRG